MRVWEHGTNWVFHQEPEVGEDQVSSNYYAVLTVDGKIKPFLTVDV